MTPKGGNRNPYSNIRTDNAIAKRKTTGRNKIYTSTHKTKIEWLQKENKCQRKHCLFDIIYVD